MFTGIVECVGRTAGMELSAGGARLEIEAPDLGLADARVGESISVAGVCLTVTALGSGGFTADVSTQTLAATTLGALESGDPVNLERALKAGDRLGGHLVTGHVDGVGTVLGMDPEGDSRRLSVAVPAELAQYVARKGSITVDGVSLTVNEVRDGECRINLVPHTLAATTLGGLEPGARVNLEVDLVARYLARLQEFDGPD